MSEPESNISEEVWDSALGLAFERRLVDPVSVLEGAFGLSDVPRIQLGGATDRPSSFGRLELGAEIARGGVGIVLRAHDNDLGRDVAIKVLREQYARDPGLLRRFVEEAQIGAQLQHPGIVPVYDLGLDDHGRPYFAMKLVEGVSLAELLRHRKSVTDDRQRLIRIFHQVCQTIGYAHSRGVVHRDLKPGNVMVGGFGEVQVMDWGFAKVLSRPEVVNELQTIRSESCHESLPGATLGTPAYMAPEQARGQVADVDTRTDVFALGGLLLEILTGRPPYGGRDALQQAKDARLEDALAALDGDGIEPGLRKLVRACLEPERDNRPKDGGAVADALGDFLEHVEQRARDAELLAAAADARFESERKSRRLTLAFGGAIAVALVLALSFFWMRRVENAQRTAQIEVTLGTVAQLEEAGKLDEALDQLHRAEGQIGTGDRAKLVELAAIQSRLETGIRDRDLELRMLTLRTKPSRDPVADEGYEDFFRKHEIDFQAERPPRLAARLRGLTKAALPAVARGLEDAAMRLMNHPGPPRSWRVMLRVADLIDADPFRRQVRGVLRERDSQPPLARLCDETDVTKLPPASALLLADALLVERDTKRGLSVLRTAVDEHDNDLMLHFRLARVLRRETPDDVGSIQLHALSAKLLHPDPKWEVFPHGGRERPPPPERARTDTGRPLRFR